MMRDTLITIVGLAAVVYCLAMLTWLLTL